MTLVAFTACEARRPAPAVGALSAAESAPICAATDAHAKHGSVGYGCAVCHVCGGSVSFGDVTFPGGSGTEGGTIVRDGSATTCFVGCHSPLGAPSLPVSWDHGPLACGDCHGTVVVAPADVRSSHLAGSSDPSGSCEACHDPSQHTSGVVRLRNGDGTSTASTCTGCHAGEGQTLGGETPPLLVGWTGSAGDFHGARPGTCRFDQLDAAGATTGSRGGLECPAGQPGPPDALRITPRWAATPAGPWAWTCTIETVDGSGSPIQPALTGQPCPAGTYLANASCPPTPSSCYPTTRVTRGFGGTLLPPYVRGQGPLSCDACHDAHSSTNAFLLASTVNGVPIPPGTIDRAGVGAEALCDACHEGERHAECRSCHRAWMISEDGVQFFDPAAPAVDPEPPGSPCFWCHGHEGILHYTAPDAGGRHGSTSFDVGCNHCHSGDWQPPTEYVAPAVAQVQPPAVSAITATTAIVSWSTDEPATSYVAYGVGTAGWIAGDGALVGRHAVTLTGLAPDTTYVWRIRTSDQFRNVTETALRTFSTPRADEVPVPDLATVWAGAAVPDTTTVATLRWYAVVAPSGAAVEYEVQLASDPGFTLLANAELGRADPSLATGNSGWIAGTPVNDSSYPPRPALGFAVTLTNLPQDDCMTVEPNVYYFRVRARDALGNVSGWSAPGVFGAMAGDPWC